MSKTMKSTAKRYRVFLVVLAAAVILGLIMPDIGSKSLELSWQNIMEMLQVLPPIFILLGLLDVWVDRATMVRYTGKGSGLKGALISFLIGSAAAGPLYASFPVAGIMMKKGSSLRNVFIFVGAWSTAKITMITFEATSLGLSFALTRLAMSVVGIVLIALITEKSLGEKGQAMLYDMHKDDMEPPAEAAAAPAPRAKDTKPHAVEPLMQESVAQEV